VLPSLIRTALIGFAIAAPSGMLLASVRIADYAQNPAFLTTIVVTRPLFGSSESFASRCHSWCRGSSPRFLSFEGTFFPPVSRRCWIRRFAPWLAGPDAA
jgi:hypothetical protein